MIKPKSKSKKQSLETIISKYSILNEPQIVDNMSNAKASGFTPNYQSPPSLFTGIEGDSPNLTFSGNTLGYTDMDTEWPGPVNFFGNQKANGFTLYLDHKSPSLFKSIVGDQGNQPNWENNISLGGSIYGLIS